jgi:hypothetical protein
VAISIITKEMNGMNQEAVKDWIEKVRAIPVADSCD